MSNKLQIRRGTKAALDMITLAAGELGWTSDTKGLYIGDGATNKLYATEYIDWSATGAEQIHADRLSGILSGVLLADGTIPLTANWNIGNFKLGINTSPSYPLHLSHTPGDENFKQIRGYANPSGTLTAAYDHYGVHEVINSFINRGTYQYNIYGGYFSAGMTGGSASTVNGLCGEFSCGSSPAIQVGRAMYAANSVNSAGISEVDGLYSFTLFSFSGECATAYGLRSTISLNTSGTVSNAYGVHAYISQSSGTLTTGYLFYGHYSGTVGTKWGIYLNHETKSYFSGQVGIKETTPAADLDIAGTLILLYGTSVNEFSTDGTLAGNSDDAVPTEKAVKAYADNLSSLAASDGSPNPALSVDAAGKVGIGTATPGEKLDVVGSFSLSGDIVGVDDTDYTAIYGGSTYLTGGGIIAYASNHATEANVLAFTNGSFVRRMTINALGKVGIGVTSINYLLELSTDSAGKPGTGGLWTVVSDERIKKDIELADLNRCYEIVKQLPLKRFGWADGVYTEEQVRDRHSLGWVANDVKNIFPKTVDAKPFAKQFPDGRREVIEDCLDLNSGQIIAALYGCVQKLIFKVEMLEAKK